MDLFEELEERSDTILERLIKWGDNYELFDLHARGLCNDLADAGREVSDHEKRHRLRVMLAYWGAQIRSETGQHYIPPRLAAYVPRRPW